VRDQWARLERHAAARRRGRVREETRDATSHTTSVRPQNRIKEQATGAERERREIGDLPPLPPHSVTRETETRRQPSPSPSIKAQKISRSLLP